MWLFSFLYGKCVVAIKLRFYGMFHIIVIFGFMVFWFSKSYDISSICNKLKKKLFFPFSNFHWFGFFFKKNLKIGKKKVKW